MSAKGCSRDGEGRKGKGGGEGSNRKVKKVVCDKVECERWCVTKKDGVCVYHLNRCKTSYWFSLLCRGTGADLPIQSNEAMAFRWMSGLINHLYLQNSV